MTKKEYIKVVVVEPMETARVELIEHTLENFQKIVGGYIDRVMPFDDDVDVIFNDEGKIRELPLNRALRDNSGKPYDIIYGNFLIAGVDTETGVYKSLTDEQAEYYSNMFRNLEIFTREDGTINITTILV